MPDPADLAQIQIENAEEIRHRQIEAANANKVRSEECIECGTPIPEKRQEITGGTEYCVDCQSINEVKSRVMR